MKLKNKIYLIQLFILISFITLFSIFYYNYEKDNKKYLDETINRITQNYKYTIENSLIKIYKEYSSIQERFYKIHKYTQEKFIENQKINLEILKNNIKQEFNIENMDINIYLIDKTYTITNSTYKKDIGFNLGVIEDAKMYLDKTNEDSQIYVASNISIDMITSELNVYSYSKISDNQFFEIGFKFNNSLYNNLKSDLENIYRKTNDKINLFRVIDTADKKEFYDDILKDTSKLKISKKEYEESLKKFDKNKLTNDMHINSIRFNQIQYETNNNIVKVYIPLLNKIKSEVLFYNNLLMTIEIDISSHIQSKKETENLFILFGLIILILLGILYYFIKYNFYKPMINMSNIIESENKIEDPLLLAKKDEFGILISKYNKLYDSLSREIEVNKLLLNENKRFIADTVHQIRTPLTNIMMNGEMIKQFQKDESLSIFIEQIDASINMLSNSYEDLAYITTFDTIEYKATKISLSDLLIKRIKFFSTISKVNFKEIISNIQENIHVYINETECERIIDNNISNAIKYATKKKPIYINLTLNSDFIILEFKTFGNAIKNSNMVFEKNYRENEAKRGLGLGLNMVKLICEKNNIKYNLLYENEQNIFKYHFKTL